MNPVAQRVLESKTVTDGINVYPLGHFHMDAVEGDLLEHAVQATRPKVSLEVGMAYGLSTLFICDALQRYGSNPVHIVLDPFQQQDWHGIGLRHVREAGFEHIVQFHDERSEFVLPRLLAQGTRLDFALIDGWHTFDQALVEFYYISRMLNVGGIVAFDDADWPSLNRLLRFLVRYPSYEVFEPKPKAVSLAGKLRQSVAAIPPVGRLLHPLVRERSWELGIFNTCVALRKVREDDRPITWHPDF